METIMIMGNNRTKSDYSKLIKTLLKEGNGW